MKIIYEDSSGRDGENGFEPNEKGRRNENSPPAVKSVHSSRKPRKEERKIVAGVPESEAEKAAENPAPTPPATGNAGEGSTAPVFNLTQEQIAFLLSQYIGSQAAQTAQTAQAAPAPKSENALAVSEDKEKAKRAGTRIVFQSPDFDYPEDAPERRSGPVIPCEEDYDYDEEDEDFDDVYAPSYAPKKTNMLPAAGSLGPIEYTLDEVDISSQKKQKAQSEKPPVFQKPEVKTAPKASASAQSAAPKASFSQPKPTAQQKITAQPKPAAPILNNVPKSLVVEEVEAPAAPEKKKMPLSEIIRLTVLSVSILAIVIASAVLIKEYVLHKENQNLESNVSNLIIDDDDETTTTKKKDGNKDTTKKEEKTTLSTVQKWEQIKAEYPNTVFPQNMQYKYAKLYATNNDFVGYLEAKGVNLSLPVVQTDNDDEYLEKNFYGEATKYGCPFVTHFNNIEPLDLNTVIFGHHMNDKTIFGALDYYKSIDGFKSAPVITFNTLYHNYKWKVIAAFITNSEEKDDNGYIFQYYFTTLSTQERFSAFLNELAQRSLYDTGVDVLPTDKLLTLSTCSHEFEDARFVVVARLVRSGESADVDVSKASENSNPRYPQAYYNAKRLTNPYYDAARWYVD